jgi:hypothetical protein
MPISNGRTRELDSRRSAASDLLHPPLMHPADVLDPFATRSPVMRRSVDFRDSGGLHGDDVVTAQTRISSGLAQKERRGRDLNPRRRLPPETVFETAAFDRSATPPATISVPSGSQGRSRVIRRKRDPRTDRHGGTSVGVQLPNGPREPRAGGPESRLCTEKEGFEPSMED